MYAKVALKITDRLANAGIVTDENRAIYVYGFEVGLAKLIFFATTVLIGQLLGTGWESIALLASFISLRSYAGGFHTSNHFRCYWMSVGVIALSLLAVKLSLLNTAAIAIGVALVLILAPVQDSNKPLDEIERRVYGARARIVLVIEIICAIALRVLGFRSISDTVFCAIVLVGLTVFAGFIKNKRAVMPMA